MTTTPIHNLTDVWNDGATTFNAFKMNVTDTASVDASKLFLLQVGGVDKVAIDKDGAFQDSLFALADNADRTKKVQFQVSGVTTGTTRTLNVPDFDGTIATLAGTEAFTNKTIDSANNTLTLDLSEGTLTGTLAEFNIALSDGSFASLDGSEVLTNKTIDSANNTLTLDLSEGTLTGTTAEFNTALSDDSFATLTNSVTLTNKTIDLTSNTLVGSKTEFNTALESDTFLMSSDLLDEDDMASDSATATASQQSVKAYFDNATVADYTALKALGAGLYSSVWVEDDERGGMFVWRSSDKSTQVTNDPGEGVWVAPSSDTTGASGAWERLVGTVARSEWWEIDAAHSGSSTDIDDEWDNLMTYLENRSLDKGIIIDFPPYNFYFDTQPNPIRGGSAVFRCAGSPYSTVFNRNYSTGVANEPFIEAQTKIHWDKIAISAPSTKTGGTAFGLWKNNDQFSVTGVSQPADIRLTVTSHTYKDRMRVSISGFTDGPTGLNSNSYYINYIDANTIELVGTSGVSIAGYTSGGTVDGAANGGDFSILDVYITGASTFVNGIYLDGAYYNDNHTTVSDGVRDIVVRGSIFQTTSAGFYGDAIIGLDFNAGVFTAFDDAIKITGNTDAGGGVNSANIHIYSVALQADLDIDYCTDFSITTTAVASALTIGSNASDGTLTIAECGSTVTIAGESVTGIIGDIASTVSVTGAGSFILSEGRLYGGGAEQFVVPGSPDTFSPTTAGLHAYYGSNSGNCYIGPKAAGSTNLLLGTTNAGTYNSDILRIDFDDVVNIPTGTFEVGGTTVIDASRNITGTTFNVGVNQVVGARQTTGVAEATFVENSGGTAVNVDSTFGGYTLQQIAQALQNHGLLA